MNQYQQEVARFGSRSSSDYANPVVRRRGMFRCGCIVERPGCRLRNGSLTNYNVYVATILAAKAVGDTIVVYTAA